MVGESNMKTETAICIGAQKTGTSWLYEQLERHPGVRLPRTGKELNFFSLKKGSGAENYENEFHVDGGPVRLDVSPSYSAFEGLAEKIHETCPEARILFIVRDPVARAVSQYRMAIRLGNIPRSTSLIEAFRANLQFIKRRGLYLDIVNEYDLFFPLGLKLTVLFFDDLVSDATKFYDDALIALGIPQEDSVRNQLGPPVGVGRGELSVSKAELSEIHDFYAPFNRAFFARPGLPVNWGAENYKLFGT